MKQFNFRILIMPLACCCCAALFDGRQPLGSSESVKSQHSTETRKTSAYYEAHRSAFYKSISPDIVPIMKRVFDPIAVQIDFSETIELGNNRSRFSYTLWHSEGVWYIRGIEQGCVNYACDGDKVYRWQNGSLSGEMLNAARMDAFHFLRYRLDPAWLMAYCFMEQRRSQPPMEVTRRNGHTTIRTRNELLGGQLCVVYRSNPLWLCRRDLSNGTHTCVLQLSLPMEIASIPDHVKRIPKEVTFHQSRQQLLDEVVFP
jgi:hypothetical protein